MSLLLKKMPRDLNILHEVLVCGELNINFDNCSGQNKNNTVLKLAVWMSEMCYFKLINFIFLVVGHTINDADCRFNLLKKEYHKNKEQYIHL